MRLMKIKDYATKKGMTLKALAKEVQVTEQGIHSSVRNNTIRADALERIAKFFDVSPVVFFDCCDEYLMANPTYRDGAEHALALQAAMADKDRLIESLQKVIEDQEEIIRSLRDSGTKTGETKQE